MGYLRNLPRFCFVQVHLRGNLSHYTQINTFYFFQSDKNLKQMRLQNLHKINTVNRSIKILNKSQINKPRLNLTLINVLSAVNHSGADKPTQRILKVLNFWGYGFYHEYVKDYLSKLEIFGYVEKRDKILQPLNKVQFLWSITPEGVHILQQFEAQLRRTRHDK